MTRVLCVDDNPDVADTEALLLNLCGYDARACYGGEDALAAADGFPPDACLLDLNMPGMDGCELAGRLRAASPRPLLVAVTAKGGDEDRRRTAAAGFDCHLVKPVDPAALLGILASVRPADPPV